MADRLRVGIVGLGYGERVLVPAFQSDARCQLAGVCGSRLAHARDVAGRLGISAYNTWQALVEDPGIDAVVIATPPNVHEAIAIAAFARGKHVFCEKPLAASLEAAQRMTTAAEAAGTAHMIDFELAEADEWRQAREAIAAGAIGRIHYVSVTWHLQTYANRLRVDSWKTRPSAAGGALNEFGSHCFHYLELLLGPIARLWAAPVDRHELAEDRDNVVAVSLELAGGATVSVSICTDAIGGDGHAIRVYGESGALALINATPDHACGFALFHGSRESGRLERSGATAGPAAGDGRIGAVAGMAGRFTTWAQSGSASRPGFHEGLRVQQLLDAAWRSRREGGWCAVA